MHIPGKDNVVADRESRLDKRDIEWQLNKSVFDKVNRIFGPFEIDLFASRLNNQVANYVSWKCDPGAWAIDALLVDWQSLRQMHAFPPFSLLPAVFQKMDREKVDVLVILPLWTTQSWWPQMLQRLISVPIVLDPRKKSPNSSSMPADKTAGLSLIRQRLESRGIQGNSASVILSAWRSATRKSYETYFRKWIHFCRGRQIDYLCPTEHVLLEFLTGLFEAGASYSSLNSARSAVASILVDQQTSIGEAPLIKKFVCGAFNARPQLPRYTSTWDVNIVFNYLRGVAPSKSLSLKQLTLKTAALLLLLSSHRGQTIMNFKIGSKMELRNNSVCFHIDDLFKTSKPGHHISPISYRHFSYR